MKQLIIGVILAVCLIGCGEKPKFSISEKDNITLYANNNIFTKVIASIPEGTAYKFTAIPDSVYDIDTSDLNAIGGYIFIGGDYSAKLPSISLSVKGKASFDKLLERITKDKRFKDFKKMNQSIEKGYGFVLVNEDYSQIISILYDPFIEGASFFITFRK